MKNIMKQTKQKLLKQKGKYLFLVVISLIGIISGMLFVFFLSKEDKSLAIDKLNSFLNSVTSNNLNYTSSLINSILSNLLYLIIIWILGISIVGIPVIIFLLFFKNFIVGFNFLLIIRNLGFKGVLVAIFGELIYGIITITSLILLSFYAINFSIRLYRVLFLKENINLGIYFKRFNQIMIICLIVSLISSIIEVFLCPFLINLFL